MPYITASERHKIAGENEHGEYVTQHDAIETPGQLNFAITDLLNSYLKEKSYTNFNEIIGVLECVKQEYYRRMVVPFEEKMCKERGDVFN